MDPWYKIVTPRKEVREGRSFNPDEFAIAPGAGCGWKTAPEDYEKPEQFFSRTCFTRALTRPRRDGAAAAGRGDGEHRAGADADHPVRRRQDPHVDGALSPGQNGARRPSSPGVQELLHDAGLDEVPEAKVAVFVGNAWDPQDGRETPWIDIARQLAGRRACWHSVLPPEDSSAGTEAIATRLQSAGGPVLILFDEVLNFLNRHRGMADAFHAFIQNLTVATTGTTHGAAVISLPRSQVEMTDWDMQWQEKITKVVRRVAKDLIANDESGDQRGRAPAAVRGFGQRDASADVAKTYADWCFERRAQLPPEWTAVDTAATEAKAREFLRADSRPAIRSIRRRCPSSSGNGRRCRNTSRRAARSRCWRQWISWAYAEGFTQARREPLITLGSAPLDVPEFRSVVLGQLGEPRLVSRHRDGHLGRSTPMPGRWTRTPRGRCAKSTGASARRSCSSRPAVQIDKVAHLPELRFALGEPDIDTTSVDNAALALEAKSYFIRRVGTDGFKIYQGDDPEGGQGPTRFARRGDGDQTALRKLIEVNSGGGCGAVAVLSSGRERDVRLAEVDGRRCRAGRGMDEPGNDSAADRRMDKAARASRPGFIPARSYGA